MRHLLLGSRRGGGSFRAGRGGLGARRRLGGAADRLGSGGVGRLLDMLTISGQGTVVPVIVGPVILVIGSPVIRHGLGKLLNRLRRARSLGGIGELLLLLEQLAVSCQGAVVPVIVGTIVLVVGSPVVSFLLGSSLLGTRGLLHGAEAIQTTVVSSIIRTIVLVVRCPVVIEHRLWCRRRGRVLGLVQLVKLSGEIVKNVIDVLIKLLFDFPI
mmetsp:Transcript_5935/g.13499  ORF Transcript_5935/g.13499 Transcript_5935/m.13499 type:complete len:213 (+) Transcript_5935:47-685(+)